MSAQEDDELIAGLERIARSRLDNFDLAIEWKAAARLTAMREEIERKGQPFKTAPKDGSTLLVQNAGGFGCPALVCWHDGLWVQVDYQGVVLTDSVAIISFDSWQHALTTLSDNRGVTK